MNFGFEFGFGVPRYDGASLPRNGLLDGKRPLMTLDYSENYHTGTPTFSRASNATFVDAVGNLRSVEADVLRRSHYHNGRRGLLLENEATRLNAYPIADLSGWSNNSAAVTQRYDNAYGMFDGINVASLGAAYHRLNTYDVSLTSGVKYYIRVLSKAGTSGRIRLAIRNQSGGGEQTNYGGNVGDLKILNQDMAGHLEVMSDTLSADGLMEWVFSFTPNQTVSYAFGVGPYSDTSGEDCVIYGLQVTDAPSSWVLGSDGSQASRARDLAILDLSGISGYISNGVLAVFTGTVIHIGDRDWPRIYQLDDGDDYNRMRYYFNIQEAPLLKSQQVFENAIQTNSPSLSVEDGERFSSAIRFAKDNFVTSHNGGEIFEASGPANYKSPTYMYLGMGTSVGSGGICALHIERIDLYAPTVSNAAMPLAHDFMGATS